MARLLTPASLFPINITGGGPGGQLDLLSMSHIDKDGHNAKYRYYAHCFCGWLFFGFVLFLVARESIFYINLRQAFLLSPVYANRISARTVLFTSVPAPYLEQAKLRKVFGDSVRRIWITGDTKVVDDLVEERDKVAFKLEAAEVKLIKLANGERLKAIKKGGSHDEEELTGRGDAESGSIAARWVPMKKRPTHKLGKFGLIGKKVDSINYCRSRLEALIPEVEAAQASYRRGDTKKVGGVFIEFQHQSDAQAAFQTLSHHQALHSKNLLRPYPTYVLILSSVPKIHRRQPQRSRLEIPQDQLVSTCYPQNRSPRFRHSSHRLLGYPCRIRWSRLEHPIPRNLLLALMAAEDSCYNYGCCQRSLAVGAVGCFDVLGAYHYETYVIPLPDWGVANKSSLRQACW